MPNGIDKDSIRVEGLGNAVIFDVIYSPPPSSKDQTKAREREELMVSLREWDDAESDELFYTER